MQIGFTKWINKSGIVKENSLLNDVDLNRQKSFLYFFTKEKIKSIIASQLPEIKNYDLKIYGFRDVNDKAEKISDAISSSVSIGMGIVTKMFNSVSTVLVLASNCLILIDRDFQGNPIHFRSYSIRTLALIETFKDYQSWDRSVFHFSDGKIIEFGAPNAMGLGGSPNKKILNQLGKYGLVFNPSAQK